MNSKQRKTGTYLGIPYDWREPTVERMRLRLWNPAEPRLFVPKALGWGYAINFYRLFHLRRRQS